MGKRGPPVTPTALKVLRGNRSKEDLDERMKHEPDPDPVCPNQEPPEYLEGESLKKWNEVFPIAQRMRVMTEADVETLGRYCELWSQWLSCLKRIRKDGLYQAYYEINKKTGEKVLKCHQVAPWASESKAASDKLLRLEQEFGFTPSSRTSLKVDKVEPKDTISSYLSNRRARKSG